MLSTMIVTKILEVIPQKSSADMLSLPLLLTTFGGVTDWYQSHGYREHDVFKHWTITTL